LTITSEQTAVHSRPAVRPATRRRDWFAAALALVLALLFVVTRPQHTGDVEEYAVMTMALSQHASPDLRPPDVAAAKRLLPAFEAPLEQLAQGMDKPGDVPKPGYFRGHDGRVYAIHFFAYPMLAAVAYKVLPLVGAPAGKCFLAVNLAFVFVLGLALKRLFGSNGRAAFGVLLFLLCGGALYGPWSSPETMSAAALLAALVFYTTGAPLGAGLLAGIAATHNPPIVFFAAFAPLLRLCLAWQRGAGLVANVRGAIGRRELLGSFITGAVFALPVAFNLWAFSTPSIIGKVSTAAELASLNRLFSFFFDLNQGMLIGVPGLWAALLLWGWRGRAPALTAAAALFSVALALPALVAHNWNSGAEGMMRYAFWGAMPLLFLAFAWLRDRTRWPRALLGLVFLMQAGAMAHAKRYDYTEFSPLSRWVLAHAPGLYNPDPEIFFERSRNADGGLDAQAVAVYPRQGPARKILFKAGSDSAGRQLCPAGQRLAQDLPLVELREGWRYLNGAPACVPR
jgi:hypothetical protein